MSCNLSAPPPVAVLLGPVFVEVVGHPDVRRLRVFQLGRRRSFFVIPAGLRRGLGLPAVGSRG